MIEVWLEGGQRPGPARLLIRDGPPETLWLSGAPAVSGALGARSSGPARCYRRTERCADGRIVYEARQDEEAEPQR